MLRQALRRVLNEHCSMRIADVPDFIQLCRRSVQIGRDHTAADARHPGNPLRSWGKKIPGRRMGPEVTVGKNSP